MGELVVDLRDVELPAGDRRLKVGIGAGHALVLVPEDVCVASEAKVGIGGVAIFERDGGGIDVDWSDERRAPEDVRAARDRRRHRRRAARGAPRRAAPRQLRRPGSGFDDEDRERRRNEACERADGEQRCVERLSATGCR